jgi:hypothetical protein
MVLNMKNSVAVFTCLLLSSLAVHAKDKRSGFYMGVDASFETMSVKTPTATENFGSGTSLIVHAGYELPVSTKYALLLGGTYDIDFYLKGGSGKEITVFTKDSEKINQKIKWGIYAAPGLYLSDNRLIYAKLIYTTMKTDPDGVSTSSPNFTSVGYGIGYRYTLKQNNLITLEWASLPTNTTSFASFKSGVEIAPNLSMITIGWAKKF